MKRCIEKKRHTRGLRRKRKDLVHAAGCAFAMCIVKRAVFDDYEIANEAIADGVRIPRSVQRAVMR